MFVPVHAINIATYRDDPMQVLLLENKEQKEKEAKMSPY